MFYDPNAFAAVTQAMRRSGPEPVPVKADDIAGMVARLEAMMARWEEGWSGPTAKPPA